MTTAAAPDRLAALGVALRGAGLVPRALAAWAGADRASVLGGRLAYHLDRLAATDPVPAAAALAVFVAGAEVAIDRLRLPIDELVEAALVERHGDRVRATVAVLPVGAALVVCDRADAPDGPDLVCWPDDSSYHLTSALPSGRRDAWLDLGTGSAFAPLARPALAAAITGVDLNPRAVAYARLGAGLSGIRHLAIEHADIGAVHAPAALVTCNAPIPDERDAAIWRRADPEFFARLWPALRACARPDGEVVVHARHDAIPPDLPGQRSIVVYTPPGVRAFAVLWWRPDGPTRTVTGRRALTAARPHLDADDRAAADAGTIAPLEA